VANVDLYDPSRDTWLARASLPFAVDDAAAARAADGSIYVAGGIVTYQPYTAVATVERYDPTTDSWSTRAPMLTTRTDFSLVAAPDGKLYAIGGDTNSAYSGTVEAYDPSTNQWTWRANLLPPARSVSAVLGPDGSIYAIGGTVNGSCCATRVDVYDPSADRWAPSTPLPIWTYGATAVGSGSNLYVLGGLDSGGGISGAVAHGTVCVAGAQSAGAPIPARWARAGALTFHVFLPLISTSPARVCA
ncbi:MAG TPA: kelch repeat-containing protein, partial [Chloroflexota bacterium]|nr:kelch repeat-containing protein [Chloroflexota bacterium]